MSATKLAVNGVLNATINSHQGYDMKYEFVFDPSNVAGTSYTTTNNIATITFPGYVKAGTYEVHLTGWNVADRLTVKKNVSVFQVLTNIVRNNKWNI